MVSGMLCEHLCPDTHLFHGVSALLIHTKATSRIKARLILAAASGVFYWKVGNCNGRKKAGKIGRCDYSRI